MGSIYFEPIQASKSLDKFERVDLVKTSRLDTFDFPESFSKNPYSILRLDNNKYATIHVIEQDSGSQSLRVSILSADLSKLKRVRDLFADDDYRVEKIGFGSVGNKVIAHAVLSDNDLESSSMNDSSIPESESNKSEEINISQHDSSSDSNQDFIFDLEDKREKNWAAMSISVN